jgi:hypothetical protein
VLFIAVFWSVFVIARTLTLPEDAPESLAWMLSEAAGVLLIALWWAWFVVLWRRRRVIAPEPAKST